MIHANLSRGDVERFALFTRRHNELRQGFNGVHQELARIANDQSMQYVGLRAEGLEADSFAVEFAGARMLARFRTEMTDAGAALGRITFYELTREPIRPELQIESLTFKPDGTSPDVRSNDGDEPAYLESCIFDVVLQTFAKLLRARSAGTTWLNRRAAAVHPVGEQPRSTPAPAPRG